MLVLAIFVSLLFWGATERYEVDFAWMLALAAVVVWLALALRLRAASAWRLAVQTVGVVVIAWSVGFSLAISLAGYYDTLKGDTPRHLPGAGRLGSPVQTAAAMAAGKPLMLEINNAALEGRGPGQRYVSSATLLKSARRPARSS